MNFFKKIKNKVMDIIKNKEYIIDKGDDISIEVIDRIENDNVHFKSGTSMSLNEVKQYAKDASNTILDNKNTEVLPSKLPEKNKALYSDDQEYGGLKKIGKGSSDTKTKDKDKDDDTINDGKPHKSRGKVISLNEETDNLKRKNGGLERRIKSRQIKEGSQKKITEGIEDFSAPDDFDNNATNSKSEVLVLKPGNKLKSLLKDDGNYEKVEFELPIIIQLPPRKALRHIEEYFDINLHEELSEIITHEISKMVKDTDGYFKEMINEKIEKHLYPRGRPEDN